MNIQKSFIFGLFLAILLVFSGCSGNNSDSPASAPTGTDVNTTVPDSNTTLPPVDVNSTTVTVILPIPAKSDLVRNSQTVLVTVRAYDSAKLPYSNGLIKLTYPNDVLSGRDIGSFDKYSSALTNGVATFTYTAPANLDANKSNIVFGFYHDSTPADVKAYTFSIVPETNQTVSYSYALSSSLDSGEISTNLKSSKEISFSVFDDKNISVPASSISSINILSLEPSVGMLEDPIRSITDANLTFSAQNDVKINFKTNTTSGIVPLKVKVNFVDTKINSIEKVFNVVVFSGEPTAMSISYASTSHQATQFKEKMVVAITDSYGNKVNTSPGLSVSMIAGYVADVSGPLNKMYHDGSINATLDKGLFSLNGGTVAKIDLLSGGSGYLTAPTVSLAGGDGKFSAQAVLSKSGSITNISILNGGSEFTTAPEVVITGTGYGFIGIAKLSTTGGFKTISLDNPGDGYVTAPTLTATGGGIGFEAQTILEATGNVKSVSLINPGTGYQVGDRLGFIGDGKDALVLITGVNGTGGITTFALQKGSEWTNATVDTTTAGNKDASFTATIGFKIKEIKLISGGSGYTSSALTFDGSPDIVAIASGELSKSLASVQILSGGYGYKTPSVSIVGDGKNAYAYATVKYPVDHIEISNGGTGYTDGALTFTSAIGDTGTGTQANAKIFGGFDTSLDSGDYKLAVFGNGYTYNVSGKWDFSFNSVSELTLSNFYGGNSTSGLGFAIGNNFRQDSCEFAKEWTATVGLTSGNTFDVNGLAELDIDYDHYLVGKDVVVMANLLGLQNSLGESVVLGEATKHTLRGTGLNAGSISVGTNVNSKTSRLDISLNDTVDYLKNSGYVFDVKVSGKDIIVENVETLMSNGIDDCTESSGRAYVDITYSSGDQEGTISLENLVITNEF